MGNVIVYNLNKENFSDKTNNFYIGRPSPLCNPFSHEGVKSAYEIKTFKTRDEAIDAYKKYFDEQYGTNEDFTNAFDEIYNKYKNGEDVYLACFCKPLKCHGDIIAEKIQKKFLFDIKNNK